MLSFSAPQQFRDERSGMPPEMPKCRRRGCGNVADPRDFKYCLEHQMERQARAFLN